MSKEKVQVNKNHYNFEKYVSIERWDSYYYQLLEALKCDGKDILYIGAGDNIVVNVLKNLGKNVTTFDFDKNVKPDICGSVTEIDKLLDKKYDVIMCCQVLEHIPFDSFESIIEKLSICIKEELILSLPNHARWYKISSKLPKIFFKIKIKVKRLFQKEWDINNQGNGEHYWEIDIKGKEYSKNNVDKIISKYFDIKQSYVPYENTYHVFYILKSKR